LVVVIRVWFLVDASVAFRFYAKGLTQDGSQLVGQVIRICARLGRGLSERHVNRLWSKGKLRWGIITKVAGFRLAIGVET
jgi:hypothetical protein